MCEAQFVLHKRVTGEGGRSLTCPIDLAGIVSEQGEREVRDYLPRGTSTGRWELRKMTGGFCALTEPQAALCGEPDRLCASLPGVDAVDDVLVTA